MAKENKAKKGGGTADKSVLWHSSSHILASAVKELHPKAMMGIGPAIEEGFYYDFANVSPFTPEDLKRIEKQANKIIARNEKFVKKEVSKAEAKKLFSGNKYKLELINELPGDKVSVYETGKFVDLCKGPHIGSAKEIGALKVLKSSAAYWKGSQKNDSMQRVYGISFAAKAELDEWVLAKEEAMKRNHVKLGKDLGLFSMHDEAPGVAFFHANGTIILNELIDFWRGEHKKAGYQEIITPMLLKKTLWETSGHWSHYKENMYLTRIDGVDYAVKPMNCPGGILVYKTEMHSYRELPARVAELGVVHRHELSGVLNGLFRVRKFTQDDAHIYCTPEQLEGEVNAIIDLVERMYSAFGFREYFFELSTRPEKSIGSDEIWKKATGALESVLKKRKTGYSIDEGEGVFYGPKVDVKIKDSLGRKWQCGTIQVDFNLPERFNLEYIGNEGEKKKPIMVHRVIYGSLERFMGIIIEHFAGSFPLWLSPVQAKVIAVSDKFNAYAKKVAAELKEAGIRAELDSGGQTVGYKIRDAQLKKIPYALVVGEKEEKEGTVTVRNRAGKQKTMPSGEFAKQAKMEISSKSLGQFF